MLKFSDGVSIDTSGDLRKIHLKDGWYVVGKGMCLPVDDEADADRTLAKIAEPRPETSLKRKMVRHV